MKKRARERADEKKIYFNSILKTKTVWTILTYSEDGRLKTEGPSRRYFVCQHFFLVLITLWHIHITIIEFNNNGSLSSSHTLLSMCKWSYCIHFIHHENAPGTMNKSTKEEKEKKCFSKEMQTKEDFFFKCTVAIIIQIIIINFFFGESIVELSSSPCSKSRKYALLV